MMSGVNTPEQLHLVAWMRKYIAEEVLEIQAVDQNHIRITYENGGMALLTCGRDYRVKITEIDQVC